MASQPLYFFTFLWPFLLFFIFSAILAASMIFSSTPLSALTVLGLAVGDVFASPTVPYQSHKSHNATLPARRGAVASESEICSRIGANVLEQGGNAADTMVATVFCTGVIGMYHSGIGGGGFMLVRGPDRKYEFIDFRESAPAAMNETVYVGNVNGSLFTGLASGVPGEVRGMAHLHEKYGKLPWKDLLMPAVKVARYGFPVTEDLLKYIQSSFTDGAGQFLINDPAWALDFAPNGTLLGLGETLTRKRYADTLETIANKGPDAFYTGAIARTMIRALQADNGTMTLADLKNYTVRVREPAEIKYRDHVLHSISAPGSGAVALSALKIVEGYDDFGQPSALNLSTHRLTEAFRFAYGERTELGDPSYVPGLDEYEAEMLNETTTTRIRGRISDQHTWNVSYYDPSGLEIKDTPGTSHVVTADEDGLAVSLTTTVNLLFGSKLIVPETGIIMNNEMNDFSIPGVNNAFGFAPSPNNYVRGGARPLSSISPIIADDCNGNLVLVTGSAGGSRIITASTLQVWNVLDRGMTAAEALAEKRLHDQLVPNLTSMELGYDVGVVAFMKSRLHNVTQPGVAGSSTAQSIRVFRNTGLGSDGTKLQFEAASEPRQKNSGSFVV